MRQLPYYIGLAFCLAARPALAAGFGSTGAVLMAESLSVRALGLGRAFSALADDESSLQSNPAGLARQQGLALTGSHVLGLLDDQLSILQGAWRVTASTGLGLQAAYSGAEEEARDAFGVTQGTFNNRELLLGVGLGFELLPGWRLGLAAKGLHEELGGSARLGIAGDAGLQADLPRGWRFGAALQNAGTSQANGGAAYATPLRVQAGVAAPFFTPRWQMAADVQALPIEQQARLLLGTELSFELGGGGEWAQATERRYAGPDRAALRGGLQLGLLRQEDPRLSLGAGLGFGHRFQLDYALGDLGALGLTHRFSLSLRFQPKPLSLAAAGAELSAPWDVQVSARDGGLQLQWQHSGPEAAGYNLYSDYGVLVERLNEEPLTAQRQRFIKVERSRVYNFYVRPVGADGKEGPASPVKTVRVK